MLSSQQTACGGIADTGTRATGSDRHAAIHLQWDDGVLHPRLELYRSHCLGDHWSQDRHAHSSFQLHLGPIAKALLDAHKRGVRLEVILDKSQRAEKCSSADFLANQGVPTLIDAEHAISHNKVMVIDGETAIIGSFNFTKAVQEQNAENVLLIRDHALAAQYAKNWKAHWQHSQLYVGRGVAR